LDSICARVEAKTASDLDGTMTIATQPLRDDDIENLMQYVASLGSAPRK